MQLLNTTVMGREQNRNKNPLTKFRKLKLFENFRDSHEWIVMLSAGNTGERTIDNMDRNSQPTG